MNMHDDVWCHIYLRSLDKFIVEYSFLKVIMLHIYCYHQLILNSWLCVCMDVSIRLIRCYLIHTHSNVLA